jgi:hypothetical protein
MIEMAWIFSASIEKAIRAYLNLSLGTRASVAFLKTVDYFLQNNVARGVEMDQRSIDCQDALDKLMSMNPNVKFEGIPRKNQRRETKYSREKPAITNERKRDLIAG